jgi:HlyD family secretion protein
MSQVPESARRRRRWIYLLGGAAVLLIAVVAVASAFGPGTTLDPSKLVKVERGDVARSVVATGKIEPRTKAEVKSKASGIVEEVLVDYGDRVRAGQTLVELDKEALRAQVREASATLQAAQAAREAAAATYQRTEVEAAGPDLPFLESAAARARSLRKDGVISDAVLDDAEKAYQVGLNKQAAAVRNLAVTKAEIARADAQAAQAQAAMERAQEDLRNATIVSPMDGVVLSRDVEVGDAVSSILVLGSDATRVATLGDMSEVYVRGKVDEADIGKVVEGQRARITVESFPGRSFEGKVEKLSPMGVDRDNVTTFEVRVSIEDPAGVLRANMSSNAEIIMEERKGVLLVPEAAVVYDKDRNASLQIADASQKSGMRKVPVKLGISNGVKTELLEGAAEGDQLVLQ